MRARFGSDPLSLHPSPSGRGTFPPSPVGEGGWGMRARFGSDPLFLHPSPSGRGTFSPFSRGRRGLGDEGNR